MEINHLAVFAAAFSAFAVGGLWYSPVLFANAWMKANNFSEEDLKDANMGVIFGLAFVFTLGISYTLAWLLEGENFANSVGYSFIGGSVFAGFSLAIVALFERRSVAYVLINAGYLTVAFSLMGAIIGAF